MYVWMYVYVHLYKWRIAGPNFKLHAIPPLIRRININTKLVLVCIYCRVSPPPADKD